MTLAHINIVEYLQFCNQTIKLHSKKTPTPYPSTPTINSYSPTQQTPHNPEYVTPSDDDLVTREGIYYQKFTDVPFNGKITGRQQGSVKDGKREGSWVFYHESGQLGAKGAYKNGEMTGAWIWYQEDGTVDTKGTIVD